MKEKEILVTIKNDILNHIKDNYDLLLNEDAKITVSDYDGDKEVRRLAYYYKLLVDGKWFDIAYDFKIRIKPSRDR